ncbi:MAG: outer membrane lipoprotein-sorting protein [Bacteroidales bacterium]|jgi:outer membrane lipoprotein-sorting protein|nr:outer membrane lipoprotein-sorting protein [Bacteroidales bacterium]
MKKNIILSMLFLAAVAMLNGQDALTILEKCDSVTYAPKDQVNKIKTILTDSKGRTQEREAIASQMGNHYRLFRFTAPASQEGIAFLSLPDDVMYLYLPAYNKSRRIASHVKNQNFAGTDLSYDDMESVPMAQKYDGQLLETTDEGYWLELKNKPGKKSEYSKMHTLIDKHNFTILKSDYYDMGGNKVKTLVNNKIENIGGYWIITDLLMTDLKKNHSTRMIFTETMVDTGLTEDDFSLRLLERQ